MSFDYEADTVEADVVLSVADAIRSHYRLEPPTQEQKLARQIQIEAWREKRAWQSEQRRIAREQLDAENEAIARAEEAAEIFERNRRLRLEMQERQREQELTSLRIKTAQHEGWRVGVENAARRTLHQQHTASLMGELEKMLSPSGPQEPQEPQIVEVEQPAEDTGRLPRLDYPKLRSWW
jgi:hypothetical protein